MAADIDVEQRLPFLPLFLLCLLSRCANDGIANEVIELEKERILRVFGTSNALTKGKGDMGFGCFIVRCFQNKVVLSYH